MKRILLSLIFLFGSFSLLHAQLNVGSTSAPDASAILQLSSTNQGLRLPNVSLSTTTTFGLAGTANAADVGMQVYNTNIGITSSSTAYPIVAGGKGVYTWDGTGWTYPFNKMMEAHAVIVSGGIPRSTSGSTTSFTSSNTTILAAGINNIPGAVFNSTTGAISIPAGVYLISVTYTLSATSAGVSGSPTIVIHGFLFDFPAETPGNALNTNFTRLQTGQPAYNATSSNNMGFTFTYMPILTSTHSINFGIGWGSNNVNLPSTTVAYNGGASISIIKLQ